MMPCPANDVVLNKQAGTEYLAREVGWGGKDQDDLHLFLEN